MYTFIFLVLLLNKEQIKFFFFVQEKVLIIINTERIKIWASNTLAKDILWKWNLLGRA